MMGLVLTCVVTARAGEPSYFECEYASSTGEPDGDTTARVMVDRARWQLVWVETEPSGWLGRTLYEIVTMTPQEVVAKSETEGGTLFLRMNTVAGEWSRELPVDKSRNPNVWDPATQQLGYSQDVQLYTEIGGACVASE